MSGPKRARRRRDGRPGLTPLASVVEAAELKRSAKADAAALDAALAAGKRLRPPPTRLEPRRLTPGQIEARKDQARWLWDGAAHGDDAAEVDE